jgi:multidrug resistance protein, MATE family
VSNEPTRELPLIARHAGTIFTGQVAVLAFGLTDTMVVARHSSESLAGLSVGAATYISIFVGLLGVVQAQLPIWAHLRGAGRHPQLGASVRQAVYLVLLTAAVGMAALLFPGALLEATQVPQALRASVESYLAILAFALPPALFFRLYSTLNQSLGKPLLVTWVQVGALAAKVPLTVWFVFGGAGLPAMGLEGCAWATLIVNYGMVVLAMVMLRASAIYAPYGIWQRLERPDWAQLRGFARLGVPTGLAIMVEVTSFTLMALFIARQGTVAAASHQVAASLAGLMYMVPLSLGIAASARVSYWLGAGDLPRAVRALQLGLGLAMGLASGAGVLVVAFHEPIARLLAGDNPQVVALASGLLLWVAVYHLADATQAVCVFLLRSFGIATTALVVYCVLLWGGGLGGGYLLAYRGGFGIGPLHTPAAFWGAGAAALLLTAAVFMMLLWLAARQRRA